MEDIDCYEALAAEVPLTAGQRFAVINHRKGVDFEAVAVALFACVNRIQAGLLHKFAFGAVASRLSEKSCIRVKRQCPLFLTDYVNTLSFTFTVVKRRPVTLNHSFPGDS